MTQHQHLLSSADLRKLGALDTCIVSNAIEHLNVRLRNEGFVSGAVHCQFPKLSPMVGYAATARVRTASPPMTQRCYYDRIDWWTYLASIPEPRVMVLQDVDHHPGVGAFIGEVHAAIGVALKTVGCVTNGAVRNLEGIEGLGFHLFAGSVSVSHSYAHIIEFDVPVEIGGLVIRPGDLLHGDRHGVLSIPLEVAGHVPAEAARIRQKQLELIEFCASPRFSIDELAERISRERTHGDQS
jgi:4-hydroxy-4-methyl-2-oxoglutarate aldolase